MAQEQHFVYFDDGSYEIVEADAVVIMPTGFIEFRVVKEGGAEQGGPYDVVAWVNPEHVKLVSMKGPEGADG